MKITIISVGKPSSPQIQSLVDDYYLKAKLKIEWILLDGKVKSDDIEKIKTEQSETILKRLEAVRDAYSVLLDESGKMISSLALAKILDQTASKSLNLIFIIGGSYGVSTELKQKVDFVWSLSELVFPHQLVRLILAEQLYRAASINNGSSYHHI